MKRLVLLLAFAFVPSTLAYADGCPPTTCGTSSEALPGANVLLERPTGQSGSLVGYDLTHRTKRFTLPAGTLAADARSYFSVRTGKQSTTVSRYDAQTGARRSGWSVAGRWWIATATANGKTLAFSSPPSRGHVAFALLDGSTGRVLSRFSLPLAYQIDALSPDAKRVFLIHWRANTYDLVQYDLATGRLRPTRLADPNEKMHGNAWGAVATRDGHWLLTLYLTADGAFVHALDLRKGVAHCIDLPLHGDFASLGATRMTLSPDERTLFLASPVLGRLTIVDLRRLRMRRMLEFTQDFDSSFVAPNTAVSANGRMLAFSSNRQVWLVDTAYAVLRGPFTVAPSNGLLISVAGLGFSPDGRWAVALRSDGRYVVLDAATGRRVNIPRIRSERFAVHAAGIGPLIGYDTAATQPVFFLPDGRTSADRSSYFSALPRHGGGTTIERFAPSTGRLVRTFAVPGRWTLGAVSASGLTVAVARHAQQTTWVRVLDAWTGRSLRARMLRGVFSVDAVTDDASRLFLIQHYRTGRYAVKALDLVHGRIWTATLREKGRAEQPLMTGQAAGQVASSDGNWLLTLYLNTREHKAFVHALNLRKAYAVCIDLPAGTRALRLLRNYSLSLTPDGGVYAANAALGVVAHVDLQKQAVTDQLNFAPSAPGGWAASALSRNGRMLYFASGSRLWGYDTAFDVLRGPVVAGSPVVGLAFSRDGRRILAARVDGTVASFDAARGTPLSA